MPLTQEPLGRSVRGPGLPTVVAAIAAGAMAVGGCKSEPAAIRFFVAASAAELVGAWAEDARAAGAVGTGVRVEVNAAASSTLARQIEAGAPADLFLSANVQWMDRLERAGLLEAGTRVDLLRNELVIATPKLDGLPDGADADLPGNIKRCVALADPEHVPAGRYARQVLEARGWWAPLQGRLVPAADVRAALALLGRGECEAGLVYATDLLAEPRVRRLGPATEHDPVVYPVAAIKGRTGAGGGVGEAVRSLLKYMGSPAARAAAQARGFQ